MNWVKCQLAADPDISKNKDKIMKLWQDSLVFIFSFYLDSWSSGTFSPVPMSPEVCLDYSLSEFQTVIMQLP